MRATRHFLLAGALGAAIVSAVAAPSALARTDEFALPTSEAFPVGVASGPDGKIWLTEYSGNRIARVTPDGQVAELTPLPTAASGPTAITAGPDGAMWFTEGGANRIGRMTVDGTLSEFGALSAPYHTPSDIPAGPQSIAAGADGNLWFTEPGAGAIGRITPGGQVTEWPLPVDAEPRGIAAGPDGNLWFTEYTGNRIGRITTGGTIAEFALPTANSRPLGIAAGADGRLWFTEYGGNRVAAITTGGAISELRELEQPGSGPTGIAAGPDGGLWFTEEGGNRVGRATPEDVVTESPPLARANSFPNRIVAGPDQNMWFSESRSDSIARATLDVPPIVTTGDATAITSTSATLTGAVNPSRAVTTFWFEYGYSHSYGNSTEDNRLDAGDAAVPVSASVAGLPPGTPFHYRVVARNDNGRSPGEDHTFATLPESTDLGTGPAVPPRLPPVRLELSIRPRRDRRAPYAYRVRGRIVLPPGVTPKAGCRGESLLWLRRANKTIASAPALVGSDCRFSGRVRVSRRAVKAAHGTLALVVRFPGNAALLRRTAHARVRFG